MKCAILIFLLLVITLGCSNDGHPDAINLRLSNESNVDFLNIIVDTSTGIRSFNNVLAGSRSEYQTFELAYSYAFIELEIEGNTYTLQPLDYVGEEPLQYGFYTYRVDANSSTDRYGKLELELIVD